MPKVMISDASYLIILTNDGEPIPAVFDDLMWEQLRVLTHLLT
ncbi:MAG: hypothetical protein R6U11_01390 [Bacteroidales bacterium]